MSMQQQREIVELKHRVDLLEVAVQALLKAHGAPSLPTADEPKLSRFGSILGLNRKNG